MRHGAGLALGDRTDAPVRRKVARQGLRYRLNVAARALAGTIGAYGVAALSAYAGARVWPADPLQATIPPSLLAFLVMPGVTLWAFLARSPVRAWAGLLGVAGVLAVVARFA